MARKKATEAPSQEEDTSIEAPNTRSTRSTKKTTTPPDVPVTRGGGRKTTRTEQANPPHPKTKKTAAVKKKTKTVTIAPEQGRGAGQHSDNVNKAEADKSGPEVRQSGKDTNQKRRQYAPVTISENEHSEGNAEDEDNDDIENDAGARPRQNRKRKRTPDSSTDEVAIAADLTISSVLPRIQNQHQVNHQMVPPRNSSSPAIPRHSPKPLDPHAITDEDQDVKHKKPIPNRALKALQTANAEEPKFITGDSDDEAPAGKRHRAAAGDGKKPTITKEDPVFDAVYKNAMLELKRQIYFVDAFPTSTKSDNLSRKVYNHGVHFVVKSDLFSQDELQGIGGAFDGKWFSCLNHQISSLRTQLKRTTLDKVNTHFGRMANDTRQKLVAMNQYWYEVSQTGEADPGRPFLNEAIIDILKERYFEGRKSLYRLFPQEFPQTLATEDGGKGPEIPPRLVALVATFIYYALTGGGKSSENWKYETFNQIYEGHLSELKKIQGDNPRCYHLILNRLFSKCMGDTAPVLAQPTVSKNDYRGLDPANL